MPDRLAWVVVGGAVLGVFALFYFLVKKAQARAPGERGKDSEPPGGYRSNLGG